jgi:hypothetical protein
MDNCVPLKTTFRLVADSQAVGSKYPAIFMLENTTKSDESKSKTIFLFSFGGMFQMLITLFLDRILRNFGLFDYLKVKTNLCGHGKALKKFGTLNKALTYFDIADFAYSRCTMYR